MGIEYKTFEYKRVEEKKYMETVAQENTFCRNISEVSLGASGK
jgi:hypothetical protein